MENEVFKIYKEFKNNRWGHRVYEVSNLGRVRLNGEIVEPTISGGYYVIGSINIHRAVAELFVPNPDNKSEIDHINTDRYDNRACNLRWVTHKENCNNPLTKQHLSEAQKGKPSYFKGKTLSEEHKRKISEAHMRKPLSEEHRAKISAAMKVHHNRLTNEKERTMKK